MGSKAKTDAHRSVQTTVRIQMLRLVTVVQTMTREMGLLAQSHTDVQPPPPLDITELRHYQLGPADVG